MAGFGFSEEQEMFQREVRNFVQKELVPGARDRAKGDIVPKDIIAKLADLNLLGLKIPAELGGQPCDWVTLGIAMEEIGKAELVTPFAMINPVALYNLMKGANATDLMEEWVPQLVKGQKVGSYAFTEPDNGSDFAAIKTVAIRDGDHYILNGEKTSVTRGLQADISIVFAKTDPTKGAKGVTAFLVPLDTPGVTRSRIPDMGFLPITRATFSLDDVRVPVRNRLGEEGRGFYVAMGLFDVFRIMPPLMCIGAAQASLDDAISFAKQRLAFGKPIGSFQGVSFKLAEAAARVEACRLLCFRTLWLADQGQPTTKEAAMCKGFIPTVCAQVIQDCLVTHGGLGYSEELPIEQRLRDCIGHIIGGGTPEVCKLIIARELLGREVVDS